MAILRDDMPRRDFLKTIGALSVAGAGIASATQVAQAVVPASKDRSTAALGSAVANGMVTTATYFGLMQAVVENGVCTRVAPHPLDPRPTVLVQAYPDRVYTQSRVKYPMVRQGFLKNGSKSDTSERGKGNFVRVSWDQAIDLVASELKRVKTSYGNQAIYGGSYGWDSAGLLHTANGLLQRMLNAYGGFVTDANDYSLGALERIGPHIIGSMGYSGLTAWPVVVQNTKVIVLWGCNPLLNSMIDGVAPDHYVFSMIDQIKKAGIKVISINPYRAETDEALNADWVPVRPNTDVALMLGMAYVLYTEKLYDQKFLDTYTVGFSKFLDYLLGKTDGQPKTPDWAAKISSIPAATIASIARTMAKNRTMIMAGWAIQRQDHGEQPHWMLVTLASMLGQIGLPGGGFGFAYHLGGGLPTSIGPTVSGLPSSTYMQSETTNASRTDWRGSAAHVIQCSRFVDMLLNPGTPFDFDGKRYIYPDIKMILWAGGNPFAHHQDLNRLVRAWRKPETIVVNEIYWTPTAKFADIVLPATTSFEHNDITSFGSTNIGLVAMKKVVEPLFESRDDFEIYAAISDKLGFKNDFTGGHDEMAWLESFYATAQKAAVASKKITLPDFATFWQKGLLSYPIDPASNNVVYLSSFRADPSSNPLDTPSGLIEIYSQTIAKMGYADCPPHPTWLEPAEWLGSSKAKQYPLHLSSPHPKYRLHSQLDNTKMEQKYNKVNGRAPIWINPADAAARHLTNGEIVRVFNDRGQALAGVVITSRVRSGVVRMEEGTWYDPAQGGVIGSLDKEGSPNVLTIDKGTSKLAQSNIANTALVQVEKFTGALPPVTAYTAPAKA